MKKHLLFLTLMLQLISTSVLCQNQIITTVAGTGVQGYNGDNIQAINAELNTAYHLHQDSDKNIYIGDYGNNRVRKIDKNGVITTIAGTGKHGYKGDGGLAINAELYHPEGIALDKNGNIYFSDDGNEVIRKIDKNGIITTFAGNHTGGYHGDGGLAVNAELYNPSDICFDTSGNLYIADTYNSTIRKVDVNGIITTFAGVGTEGFSGDNGPAASAQIDFPYSMTFDKAGNLFFGDYKNNRIRKISTSGIITTIAGNGTQGYSGDGGQAINAEFFYPCDIIFDKDSNIIFTDQFNNVIRKIDRSGIITAIAGTGKNGFSGDGGLAIDAKLFEPMGLLLDSSGNILVSDRQNNRIRKITPGSMPLTIVNFISTLNKNEVLCQWQTLNEINTSYFKLQRSADEVHFTDIGKITASKNSSGLTNYSFIDQNPMALDAPIIFYRLICVDENSAATISKISTVNFNKPGINFSIWPNPVKDNINISLKNFQGKIVVDIYDIAGDKLVESFENAMPDRSISIGCNNLKSGVYMISIIANNIVLTKGFVK